MGEKTDFIQDEIYSERLLISLRADQTELNDNIRVARVLLSCFADMYIIINEHLLTIGLRIPNILSTASWATGRELKVRMVSSRLSEKQSSKAARWWFWTSICTCLKAS